MIVFRTRAKLTPRRRRFRAAPVLTVGVIFAVVDLLIFFASAADPDREPAHRDKNAAPSFAVVRQIVERHFAATAGHRPSNLITQCDVEPVLQQLAAAGFPRQERKLLLDVVLPDGHQLAVMLRTTEGATLLKKMSELEAVYERFDRLAGFADGRKILRTIIAAGDVAAAAVVCTPEFARVVETQYYHEPNCRNFDSPTGRAYTAAQFLEHLQTLHRLSAKNLARPAQ